MRRREFIALLGSAAVGLPRPAYTATAEKTPTIGFIGASSDFAQHQWTAAFLQRLHELGWVEDHTIRIEYRWAEGRNEHFVEFAEELVQRNVDVIVTDGGAAVAAKRVTTVIPIVFAVSADPLGTGLVASLAHPGGNVTGSTVQAPDLAGKRVGLLHEVVPALRRLAVLVNAGYPAALLEAGEVETSCRPLGIEVIKAQILRVEDFAPAIAEVRDKADALYVCTDSLANSNRALINASALDAGLATMHGIRTQVEAGGLMSYGASFTDLFRRAGDFVDKILRGAKPSDLPVEQPTKFELVINQKTAKRLDLRIPQALLATADEIIE
jgi:putative ABC transport system substrate-binding protein